MGKYKREREISQRTKSNYNKVHDVNNELKARYGDAYADMSRDSIYRRIAERTGYSIRRISFILNHTTLSVVD